MDVFETAIKVLTLMETITYKRPHPDTCFTHQQVVTSELHWGCHACVTHWLTRMCDPTRDVSSLWLCNGNTTLYKAKRKIYKSHIQSCIRISHVRFPRGGMLKLNSVSILSTYTIYVISVEHSGHILFHRKFLLCFIVPLAPQRYHGTIDWVVCKSPGALSQSP